MTHNDRRSRTVNLSPRWSRRIATIAAVGALLSVLAAVAALADTQPRSLDEWQLLHDYLRAEILRHSDQYPRGSGLDTLKNSCEVYVRALEVFAADRDQALTAAQEAQASADPAVQAFFDKFMDLVDLAQDFGDGALQMADIMLRVEDNFGPIPGATLTLRVDLYAKCLYDNARRLQFDEGITRRQVQRMLQKAIDDLDRGWSLRCGEIHEAVYCGWMYPDLERNPDPFYVEERLKEADKIREQAPYYELDSERRQADELMNRYLKDTLCLNPARGHKWYLQLAEQYRLNNAREYIDGFYAKLHGHVWIEEAGQRRPANGAKVTVTDPKDQTTWQAMADREGYYEIDRGLLHNHKGKDDEDRCPVFKISAESQGDRVDDTYEGNLREPDTHAEFTKDLVIQRDDQWDVTITYTEDVEGEEREGDKRRTVSRHYAATYKARVLLAEADSQRSLFRSEDCSIELHDNYHWHYIDNECNHRGGFTGEKAGRVPLPIEVQFNPGSQRYYFRFDPPSEVIPYKFAGQLLGPDQHCTGAWEYEAPSSRSVLPADWEEMGELRQYTPGQTHITGNAILDGGMALVWPDNPQMFEPQMRGDMFQAIFMMNAQIGGYSPLILSSLPIKQTLTWEIKRPE